MLSPRRASLVLATAVASTLAAGSVSAQDRGRTGMPALRNPAGPAPLNPTGPAPLNPTGRIPTNPAGPAPLNPTGPAPFNPTGPAPLNPTGRMPANPAGPAPLNPTGPAPFNPTGFAPLNPTGPAPFNPTGPAPLNPTGDPPLNAAGLAPLDPTGSFEDLPDHPAFADLEPLEDVFEQDGFGAAGTYADVVDDRGYTETVARSFFCGGHNRGFASQQSFASHLARDHGVSFADAANFLVDDGGVWVLPVW